MNLGNLALPFAAHRIHWRAGSVSKNGERCTLLAYLDARDVMDRLDKVVGPGNWQDRYGRGPDGGVMCKIGVLVDGHWVWKSDGAENTQVEAVKGGYSDAFKRSAVKWGVGRYLYRLDSNWHRINLNEWANGRGVDISSKGRHLGWVQTPQLPEWALPKPRRAA